MGMALIFERNKQFEDAIKTLNSAIVDFNSFLPAYLVKARVMIALDEWDQADKVVQKILGEVEPENIEALGHRLLYILTRDFEESLAIQTIQQLNRSLNRNEPRNEKLFSYFAECFGMLCHKEE